MKMSFLVRKKSIVSCTYGGLFADIAQKWTDGRSKLLRELLSSMQIIKVFTYEIPFLKRTPIAIRYDRLAINAVSGLRYIRRKEMVGIRKILIIRAANQAMAFSIPVSAKCSVCDRVERAS